jgi:uncharacterized protein
MHFHIILTERCNSQCRYCYEKSMKEFDNGLQEKWSFDFSAPADSEVDINKLKKFLSQDKNPVLVFYGGEPLLEIDKIKKIIDNLEGVKFCMQTNGKFLDKLPSGYINKISKILVSVDGNKERTDFNRGAGTYDLVLRNLNLIRQNGFSGEIVARMTISQDFPDVYEQVRHLLENKIFDSVHWQIDAGFYKNDFNKEKFSQFAENYNNSVSKLVNYWLAQIKTGKVLKLYPFVAIINSFLKNEPTKLRCGSGYENYTITTAGKLSACPIVNSVEEFYCGNLDSKIPELKKIYVEEPCTSCNYLNLCGGRCLYSNKAKLWPEEGENLICKTVKHLIDELKKILPEIKKLISGGKIKEKDFDYEKYFGPEIIP